jgi:hypothetical protein
LWIRNRVRARLHPPQLALPAGKRSDHEPADSSVAPALDEIDDSSERRAPVDAGHLVAHVEPIVGDDHHRPPVPADGVVPPLASAPALEDLAGALREALAAGVPRPPLAPAAASSFASLVAERVADEMCREHALEREASARLERALREGLTDALADGKLVSVR